MSSQSEIVVTVKAGQTEMPVRAGGDFIFVKEAARNVRVIVDGQAINMGRGDKRRIERSEERKLSGNLAFDSFEVSNLGDDDLRLVFVVGEGDYNSQIVTGELSVSDYIQTNLSGTSKTNPTTLKKRVGLVSMVETPIVSGEKQNSGEMPDLDGDGSTACVFWHDGKFWAMGGSKIGSFTKDSVGAYDEVKTIDLTDVTLTNINHMRGAVCKHGNVYFVNGYDLFTFNMGLVKAKLLV